MVQPGRHQRFKLILFNLVKPCNIGLLMRSAYAFGCDELLLVGRKKYKLTGSSGTSKRIPTRHFYSMAEVAAYCRESGFSIYGVEIGGTPLDEVQFDSNVAFVMGNEGRGISDAEAYCEAMVTIPQWGGVHSLNVSVAGAIVMFEFQRQQDFPTATISGQQFQDAVFP